MRKTITKFRAGLFTAFLLTAIVTVGIYWKSWNTDQGWLGRGGGQTGMGSGLLMDQASDHHHPHGDHMDISAAAAKSLGLQLREVRTGPFEKTLHIPAEIIEKPGQSGLAITSPVQGIVLLIHRFPGQALDADDLLFTLRVADEALEAAQLSLLDILTRITVTELEIQRLDPLAESGAIVGRRKLEMEYQLKQLVSERSARVQELRLRGLSENQVKDIVQHRKLVDEIEVRMETTAFAETLAGGASTATRLASAKVRAVDGQMIPIDSSPSGPIFTLEQLDVFPGRRVAKGEQLCHIANHFELFVRGYAFDSDVAAVSNAMSQAWSVTAETGTGDSATEIHDLTITYIDNHVDKDSQTFPFYLSLPNRVISEQQDAQGRLFRSWQFKPGQRAHLYVPLETWSDQIVLPRDAVVSSGPESLVFRLPTNAFQRRLNFEERLARMEKAETWELEPVAVQILHQDRNHCVIAQDGELRAGDIAVVNRSYQLFLAWKLQSSGGSGHAHEH